MDNKVLDEAVEVARLAYEVEVDGQVYSPNVPADAMRVALLASLPVLLGEPVAWADPDTRDVINAERRADWEVYFGAGGARKAATYTTPLYAPNLGEGDGR